MVINHSRKMDLNDSPKNNEDHKSTVKEEEDHHLKMKNLEQYMSDQHRFPIIEQLDIYGKNFDLKENNLKESREVFNNDKLVQPIPNFAIKSNYSRFDGLFENR